MLSKEVSTGQQHHSAPQGAGDQSTLPHIKEEQEDLLAVEEERSPQEAEMIRFILTSVPVRKDEDEEEPQTSQLQQDERSRDRKRLKVEADGEERDAQPAAHASQPAGCYVWEVHDAEPAQNKGDEDEDSGPTAYLSSQCPPASVQIYSGGPAAAKPFGCSECGNRFTQYKYLKNHMRLHTDGKSLSCSVCKKTFLWKTVLDAHMRIHTGEKPYSCSVCGAKFTHGSNLASHLKTHTGVKPYGCSVCQMSFSRRHHLSRHMKIHTGEKPFSCYFCGKTFRERAYLTRHMNAHTADGV